jgi:hypothetical protein
MNKNRPINKVQVIFLAYFERFVKKKMKLFFTKMDNIKIANISKKEKQEAVHICTSPRPG